MKEYPFFPKKIQGAAPIFHDCRKKGGRPLKDNEHGGVYLLAIFAFALITFISYSCRLAPLIFTTPTPTPTITNTPYKLKITPTFTPYEIEIYGLPPPPVPLKAMREAVVGEHSGPFTGPGAPETVVLITYYLLPDTTFADVENHYSTEASKIGWIFVRRDTYNQILEYQTEDQGILLTYSPGDKEQRKTASLALVFYFFRGRKF